MEQLKKLKNGTDIRGIALEYPGYDVNLTENNVKLISKGFGIWLQEKLSVNLENLKIAVGMDSRLSGSNLKDSIIKTFMEMGCNVYDCNMATTPAMFMSTLPKLYNCDGAIMITASHLPYYYNGLKFFTKEGGCESEDIDAILNNISKELTNSNKLGNVTEVDLIHEYSKLLTDFIIKGVNSSTNYNKPLEGLIILIDAGNGAGGFFADKVLKALGADTTGSQFVEPDGRFPNHIPNPERKEAMEAIRSAVLKNHADLGIIFDADVDRVAIVDSEGDEINRNTLIALISSIILEEHPKSTIVTDSVTSAGLSEFIKNLGGIHHRFKRGYRNVINEAKRLNNENIESYLAIETSGHAALKENYFLDDGAYLAAKILIKMAKLNFCGKNIQSLIENLKQPEESTEIRVHINSENFKEYGNNVINNLINYVNTVEGWSLETKNYEGIKVNCNKNNGDGWFLLRMSLHEPLLALNLEADTKGSIKIMLKRLQVFFDKFSDLEKITVE